MIATTRRVTISTSSAPSRNDHIACALSSSITSIFPAKLHDILQTASENAYEDVISWSSSDKGKSFTVYDTKRFAEEIMPIYFGSNKYRSFQKNLNMWGFKQATRREGKYSHPLFCRDSPQLIHLMKRQLVKHQIERLKEKQRKESATTTTTETAMSPVRRPRETVMKVLLEGSPSSSQSLLSSYVGTTYAKSTSASCLPRSSSCMNDHLCAHDYATALSLPSKVAAAASSNASSTTRNITDFLQGDGHGMNWLWSRERSRIPPTTTPFSSYSSGNSPLVLANNIIGRAGFQSYHDDHYDNHHQEQHQLYGPHSTDETTFSCATGSTAAVLVPDSSINAMLLGSASAAVQSDSGVNNTGTRSSFRNIMMVPEHHTKNEIQALLRDIILIEKQLLLYVHEKQQHQIILQQKQLEFIMTELEIIEKLKQQCSNIGS